MDFKLSDNQQAFQDTARKFTRDHFLPNAAKWDEEKIFPEDALRAAAALGFAGMYVSPDFGGAGLGRVDGAVILEELAAGCPSTAAYISIHNMAAAMVDRYGTADQKNRYLEKLCSMELFSSYCLTEPSAGSDAAALRTKAVRDGDHYVLNGTKAFISGGGRADVYLCMVRTGGEGPKGISCLIVDKGTPGLSFGAQEKKMGWNSQPTAMVIFEECRVPVTNCLGEEGQGFKIAMSALDGGRISIGTCSVGAARAALEAALAYVQTREQFDQPLSDFQTIQFKLADMATELTAARLMLYNAAAKLDETAPDAPLASAMAKRFATDIGFQVCDAALQLHGGYGYLKDYPLERLVRDTRVHRILEGTNEIMRVVIARHLLQGK